MLRNGASYTHLVSILPSSASDGQRETFDGFVLYVYIELFGRPPDHAELRDASMQPLVLNGNKENVDPTQFWTTERLQAQAAREEESAARPAQTHSGHSLSPTVPITDPARATQAVAERMQVPAEHMIIPTPPDGLCLYHCFTAWELGETWMLHRNPNGFCSDGAIAKQHTRLATRLRRRLIAYLEASHRPQQAERLALPGAAGFPGGDELPYLAELLRINIVEHDLQHPAQPSFTHCGGTLGAMHIGHTITERGQPHWVLLCSSWSHAGATSGEDATEVAAMAEETSDD